jgi:penicillin-binding protein 2B
MVRAARLVMESVAKYKGIYNDTSNVIKVPTYQTDNYINKNINDVKASLEGKNIDIVTIGSGDVIVNQYPKQNITLKEHEKLFLVTNNNDIIMPNLFNWSLGNAKKFFELANISYMTEGYGYVKEQSIPEGTLLDKNVEIKITLYDKYYYVPPQENPEQNNGNPETQ